MSALLTWAAPYILGALALIGGIWGYGATKKKEGVTQAENKHVRRRAQASKETHERINNATLSSNNDDANRERLRERGERNGGA